MTATALTIFIIFILCGRLYSTAAKYWWHDNEYFFLEFFSHETQMEIVQKISKPALVDFLRLCDRKRWCTPRIRYASIRSKPELCEDLCEKFDFLLEDSMISLCPRRSIRDFPTVQYDLDRRMFSLNGQKLDVARVSRKKPLFHLERRQVTLAFFQMDMS